MEKTNFETLHIYKLSEQLADRIWRIVLGWDYLAKNTVGTQIIKAADSIGANIAEGTGRGTNPEFRRFIKSSREVHCMKRYHWLRRAFKRKSSDSSAS